MERQVKMKNGDSVYVFIIYTCLECGKEVGENVPHFECEGGILCTDCAFKNELISEDEYLQLSGISIGNAHAKLNKEGRIIIWIGGNTPPWERSVQDIRRSKEYSEWRSAVFARDKYTCQHCKRVGGVLNAHHIKPFSNYENLRLDVSNGITLCKECHMKVHSRRK